MGIGNGVADIKGRSVAAKGVHFCVSCVSCYLLHINYVSWDGKGTNLALFHFSYIMSNELNCIG